MPDLSKSVTLEVQLKSCFIIILNISKVERLHDIATVWSAIFNLAPYLDLICFTQSREEGYDPKTVLRTFPYREDYSTAEFLKQNRFYLCID